jgi:hypothetical protein
MEDNLGKISIEHHQDSKYRNLQAACRRLLDVLPQPNRDLKLVFAIEDLERLL